MTSPPRNGPDATGGAGSRQAEPSYSIGELASEFALTTRAIRFYESKDLIRPARRGATRCYDREDRARLKLILRGKSLGLSLEEIAEFLSLYDAAPRRPAEAKAVLDGIDRTVARLVAKRADLDLTLKELRGIRTRTEPRTRGKATRGTTRSR